MIKFISKGFLSTESNEAKGNYGLLDQIKALEWIRENSRYFGGMNDSVTVMGSGAGGISGHLLSLSPRSRGARIYPDDSVILHRFISHSGTAYSPHAIIRDPNSKAKQLAVKVGCPIEIEIEMMFCLRKTSSQTIINAIPSMFVS